MKLHEYIDACKRDFKHGVKDGYVLSQQSNRYIMLAAFAILIFISAVMIYPTDAYVSRDEIAYQYGLSDLYLYNSSYPGAHVVDHADIKIALFPGVNKSLIEESLVGINPFYRFTFIDYHTAKYFTRSDRNGLIYSGDKNTVVISMADNPITPCGYGTHGSAYIGVQIWIKRDTTPTATQIRYLIEHELDHVYGLPCNPHPDANNEYYSSENVTARYTESTKTYGEVTVNYFKGNSDDWQTWKIYL